MKVKNDKSKCLPHITAKWEDEVLKCDNCEIRLSRKDPHLFNYQVQVGQYRESM